MSHTESIRRDLGLWYLKSCSRKRVEEEKQQEQPQRQNSKLYKVYKLQVYYWFLGELLEKNLIILKYGIIFSYFWLFENKSIYVPIALQYNLVK